jgi:hypothetical protein
MACSTSPVLLDFAGWELGVQCPRRAVADPTARIEKLDLSHSGVTVIPMVRIAGGVECDSCGEDWLPAPLLNVFIVN